MRVCRVIYPALSVVKGENFLPKEWEENTTTHSAVGQNPEKQTMLASVPSRVSRGGVNVEYFSSTRVREWPFDLGSWQICVVFGIAPLLDSLP